MNLIKSICVYIKNSFISLFGFIIVKFVPKQDILKIKTFLKNKKVLVLGTGPSLDKLNQNLIDNYDVIIFLNNAISISKKFNFKFKEKIVFNSDLFRFKQLKKNFYELDNTWNYIFIPIHLQLVFSFIFFYFKRNVFLIIPKFRFGSPFEKNVTKSLITYKLIANDEIKLGLKINNFKSFPHTAALNSFFFLISCKVFQLHYLGCDFSTGQSSLTNYKGEHNFSNKKIYLWVNKLKKLAHNNSVDFKNLK